MNRPWPEPDTNNVARGLVPRTGRGEPPALLRHIFVGADLCVCPNLGAHIGAPLPETIMLTHLKSERGFTLIEVLITAVMLTIVILGSVGVYTYGISRVNREAHRRVALELAHQRVEELFASAFDSVQTGVDSLLVDNVNYARLITAKAVDDSADGLGAADIDADTTDYKRVEVAVKWFERGDTNSVQLTTLITP